VEDLKNVKLRIFIYRLYSVAIETNAVELQIMSTVQPKKVLNLVIDTDVGSDDAMAIILCCAAEKKGDAKIWGVTCVHGNTSLQNVCSNTVKTLHTMGRMEVSARADCLLFVLLHVERERERAKFC
jgi:hypothetical protein